MSATERIRITNWSLSPPLPGRTFSVADSSAAYHLVRSSSLLSTRAICSQQACDFTHLQLIVYCPGGAVFETHTWLWQLDDRNQ